MLAVRPKSRPAEIRVAALVGVLSVVLTVSLQSRIGIPDVDSYAYIVGAYSIAGGNGYRSLSGEPLNHWPPVYSLLLAPFPRPLIASSLPLDFPT